MSGRGPSAERSQSIQVAAYLGRMLLGMAVTVILGRLLDRDEFGFYTLVGSVYFLGHLFLDLGAGPLAVAEIARDSRRERPLLEGLMAFRRLIGLVLAVCVGVLATVAEEGGRRWVLLGAGASLILLAPLVLMVSFQVRQRVGLPALLGTATQIGVLLGVLLFWALDLPGFAFAWLLIGRELINALIIGLSGARLVGFVPREGVRGRDLTMFLRRALVQGCASLLHAVYFQVDVFFVRGMAGAAQLGAYSAAFRPVNPLFHIPGVAMQPLLPVLARAAARDRVTMAALVRGVGALLFGFGAVGGVAAVVLAPELISVLYGSATELDSAYSHGAYDAAPALRWMGVAMMAVFAAGAFTTALVADRGERVLLVLGVVGLLVNVAGNFALIPMMGFTGAAFTTAVTELVVLCCAIVFLQAGRGLRVLGREHLEALIPAALLAPVLLLSGGSPMMRVALGVTGGCLALVVLWRLPFRRRFFVQLREAEVRMNACGRRL